MHDFIFSITKAQLINEHHITYFKHRAHGKAQNCKPSIIKNILMEGIFFYEFKFVSSICHYTNCQTQFLYVAKKCYILLAALHSYLTQSLPNDQVVFSFVFLSFLFSYLLNFLHFSSFSEARIALFMREGG